MDGRRNIITDPGSLKVLVADDNRATRFALRTNLSRWGFDVVESANGLEAWEVLTGIDPPRIAILDWVMPGLDGVEICGRLENREAGPFIYTILLTSKNETEDLVYALEHGAHNFQSKPISPNELRGHVNVGRRLVAADDKLKEYAAKMERLATTDPLTGLFNRRCFFDLAEKELARSRRHGRPLAVLMLDVDHFKAINDTHGHAVGDEVLKKLADLSQASLRENDFIGRLGGEEFAVVLPETDGPAGIETAERLRRLLAETEVAAGGIRVRYTVSIGAAVYRADDPDVEAMLRRADDAMYRAKSGGRNRVVGWNMDAPPAGTAGR